MIKPDILCHELKDEYRRILRIKEERNKETIYVFIWDSFYYIIFNFYIIIAVNILPFTVHKLNSSICTGT